MWLPGYFSSYTGVIQHRGVPLFYLPDWQDEATGYNVTIRWKFFLSRGTKGFGGEVGHGLNDFECLWRSITEVPHIHQLSVQVNGR